MMTSFVAKSRFVPERAMTRKEAQDVARVLRQRAYGSSSAAATRLRGRGPHGWEWGVNFDGERFPWLGSLLRAISYAMAGPKGMADELDKILAAISKACEISRLDDDAMQAVWRLSGPEGIIRLVDACPQARLIYGALGYAWSFDADWQLEGADHLIDPSTMYIR